MPRPWRLAQGPWLASPSSPASPGPAEAGLLGERPELIVRNAAPPLGSVAERNDERLLVSLRSRLGEVLDQLHEGRDLFRRRLDPAAAELLGDRKRPGVFSEDESAFPP